MLSKNVMSMVSSDKNRPIIDCHPRFIVKFNLIFFLIKKVRRSIDIKYTKNLTLIDGDC